jgi:hypothetical protein
MESPVVQREQLPNRWNIRASRRNAALDMHATILEDGGAYSNTLGARLHSHG